MKGSTLLSLVIAILVLVFLLGSMARHIRNEKRSRVSVWKDFGLSIALAVLFFVSWIGQGLSQWDEFTEQQAEHSQEVSFSEFASEFMSRSMENWQSEFLQLFSFVVLAGLYIHRGSAESKDSDEEMQKALARIEKKLDERSGKS